LGNWACAFREVWVTDFGAKIIRAMKQWGFSGACFGVLFLAAPLPRAQNPDELLAVRFPARHGYITWPAAPPFPTGRTAASSNAISQAVALRPSRAARGDAAKCRGQAADGGRRRGNKTLCQRSPERLTLLPQIQQITKEGRRERQNECCN
jgi:hypothetical protein